MSQRRDDQKKVVYRRIRGRIVPISVGSLLAYSAVKNDRTYKIGKSKVSTTKLGSTTFYASSSKGKLKAYGFTGSKAKAATQIQYVKTLEKGKGFGRDILKGISFHETSVGKKKYMRGVLVSPDTVKFSEKQNTKFLKYYFDIKKKSAKINLASALSHIKKTDAGGTKFSIVSTTRIPKIRKIASKLNWKSPTLLAGSALVSYGLLKRNQK